MFGLDPGRRRHRILYQVGFGVFLLALWMAGGLIWPRVMPSPVLIIDALVEQTAGGEMGEAMYFALRAIILGYVLAVVAGITIGLAMGMNSYVETFLDPYLDSLYAMPLAALIPAMILWFGTGLQIRTIIVFFFAFFPIVINTLEGVQSIPARLYELSMSYQAGKFHMIRHIIIPHELPYILAGLRLGAGLAVRGLVVTELLVSVTGFGQLIMTWSAAFRMEGVISVVLVLMAMGIGATWLLKQVELRAIPWDVSKVET